MDDSEGARWLSYAEFAAMRGISRSSAIRMARRHGWPRRPGNDGSARVAVPVAALVARENDRTSARGDDPEGAPGDAGEGDRGDALRALSSTISLLESRLTAADDLLERERQHTGTLIGRVADLEAELVKQREQRAHAEGLAEARQAEIERLLARKRRWWRRRR